MTSNQLTYWRNEEQKRANLKQERLKGAEIDVKEKELTETARHNKEQEAIAQVKNELESRGLDLKQQEQVLKLAEDVAKYGVDMYEIPESLQKKYPDLFAEHKDADIASMIDFALKKIGNAWESFTGGGIGQLAKLF